MTRSGGPPVLHPARGAPGVADGWEEESVLAGITVNGLARHLVSRPESAVEFLRDQPLPSSSAPGAG